ncbi:MAG: N-acetyltransferase [Gemmatimonadetes bacterium]|nr:N-acetyltransferase [Gemmatimonadota bacterium]
MAEGSEQVTVVDNPGASRYEAQTPEGPALLTYEREAGRIFLLHTEVPDALEGRGVGSELVRTALDQAREQGVRVVPYCAFVQAYLKRHPEYQELVQAPE